MTVPRIRIDDQTRLLVLTGAGISAESGIQTFRGAGGLWENYKVEEVASPIAFRRDPALVWRFYSERRAKAKLCAPNAGHLALAALERHLGDRFLLATQNVDGLHRRAGNRRMVEMHGHLFSSRCSECDRKPFLDDREYQQPPRCTGCGGLLRPHIVWFGEMLDHADLQRIADFLASAAAARAPLVFLAVGTSGAVYPAAGLVDTATRFGAETWLVNADEADNGSSFQHFVRGKSGEVLPGLLGT